MSEIAQKRRRYYGTYSSERLRRNEQKASEIVADRVKNLEKPVLGLATGSTPEGMYKYLIEKYQAGEVSFKTQHLLTLMNMSA